MQRNKQVAMGRKKFNMDPKKVCVCEKQVFFRSRMNVWNVIWLSGVFLRGSNSWLRMTCWRIPATTLLSSSTKAKVWTKRPSEIIWERGQQCSFFPHLLCLNISLFCFWSLFSSSHPCERWKQWMHSYAIALFPLCQAHTPSFPKHWILVPHFKHRLRTVPLTQQSSICLWLVHSFIPSDGPSWKCVFFRI